MLIIWAILQFLAGFIFLVGGAEIMIRGASRLALRLRIEPIVIGLTVVAFGTSMPELVVSIVANLRATEGSAIAIGNVVGSNIANLGLILGMASMVYVLTVNRHIVRLEFPFLLGLSVFFTVLALWGGSVSRVEGILLTIGLVAYLTANVVWARRQYTRAHAAKENLEMAVSVDERIARPSEQPWFDVLLIIMGVGGLLIGADWLVQSATTIATAAGVSEMVIGLTLVAIGTSLPEAATSLVAVFRGQGDLAIGNVVGSNFFNILGIAGISAIIKPLPVPGDAWLSFAVMLLFTALVYGMIVRLPHRLQR
ncbi:MAG: calcium/sodium antiporter, partial [Caldilineaceae bacterium]|nr:calcium/sodium antiporter [Caldilineaceae bacterium]